MQSVLAPEARRDYLRSMHGVCVVENCHASGWFWINEDTGAKQPLASFDLAWDDAWAQLEGW